MRRWGPGDRVDRVDRLSAAEADLQSFAALRAQMTYQDFLRRLLPRSLGAEGPRHGHELFFCMPSLGFVSALLRTAEAMPPAAKCQDLMRS